MPPRRSFFQFSLTRNTRDVATMRSNAAMSNWSLATPSTLAVSIIMGASAILVLRARDMQSSIKTATHQTSLNTHNEKGFSHCVWELPDSKQETPLCQSPFEGCGVGRSLFFILHHSSPRYTHQASSLWVDMHRYPQCCHVDPFAENSFAS